MKNRYPDEHNCGLGMVYDSSDEKYIAKLEDTIKKLKVEIEDLKKAGTPYWKERDLQNALILENNELKRQLKLPYWTTK